MLLIAFNIIVLKRIFNVVDVFLRHHRVTEARIQLQQRRLDGNVLGSVREFQSFKWQRPALLCQADPLNIIIRRISLCKILKIVPSHNNRPLLLRVLREVDAEDVLALRDERGHLGALKLERRKADEPTELIPVNILRVFNGDELGTFDARKWVRREADGVLRHVPLDLSRPIILLLRAIELFEAIGLRGVVLFHVLRAPVALIRNNIHQRRPRVE